MTEGRSPHTEGEQQQQAQETPKTTEGLAVTSVVWAGVGTVTFGLALLITLTPPASYLLIVIPIAVISAMVSGIRAHRRIRRDGNLGGKAMAVLGLGLVLGSIGASFLVFIGSAVLVGFASGL